MICLDQFRNKSGGTEIPKGLINSIDSIYSSLSALPTDITSMMSLVASLTGGISTLSVNTGILSGQIYDVSTNLINYELTSNAFNSSVLTDYAKTSDIPTNTGGGGGNYQYAFSELPSDANYNNLYGITGDVGNITFNPSNYSNLIMTMAGGYFNSNSIISTSNSYIHSLCINNISEFYNNSGYIATLQLNNCNVLSANSINGVILSLVDCSIKPDNTFSFKTYSCENISISSLSLSSLASFKLHGAKQRVSSLTLNGVWDVDMDCYTIFRLAITGSGSTGLCNINAYSFVSSYTLSDFSAADINCFVGRINYGEINSLKILNMNCTSEIWHNKISNVYSNNINCGSSFRVNSIYTNTICNINVPDFRNNFFREIQTCNFNADIYVRNSLSSVKSVSINAEYLGYSTESTQFNHFTNITNATLSGYSMIYNRFSNIGNVNLDYSNISNNSYSTINGDLNISCDDSCEKNGYTSIANDIHLSGHSFNSNTYSSFMGNLYVNCDMFGDYIEHKVSVSNWDFSNLDNNWFNITAADYFGNVGGVKNVNISAMTFRGNVGAIENLNITAPVMTDQDQMIGLKNVNINCGLCHSLIFLGNTDLNLNITISDSLKDISPEGRMTLDLRYHETSSPGNIGLYSDYFRYLELKMPESVKKDFTQLFNKDNYHTSSLWKTVSINMLNYIPKSDWMSYNTDLINSNICSWCGMPVSLLA